MDKTQANELEITQSQNMVLMEQSQGFAEVAVKVKQTSC